MVTLSKFSMLTFFSSSGTGTVSNLCHQTMKIINDKNLKIKYLVWFTFNLGSLSIVICDLLQEPVCWKPFHRVFPDKALPAISSLWIACLLFVGWFMITKEREDVQPWIICLFRNLLHSVPPHMGQKSHLDIIWHSSDDHQKILIVIDDDPHNHRWW